MNISRSRVSLRPRSTISRLHFDPLKCNLKAKPGLVFNSSILQKDIIFYAVSDNAENRDFKIVSISLHVEQTLKNFVICGTLLSGRKSLKPLFLSTQSSLPEFSHGARGARGIPGARGMPGARRIPGSGVRKCCSDPTSTRAGGQDDVS